jgi:hypothetical protein
MARKISMLLAALGLTLVTTLGVTAPAEAKEEVNTGDRLWCC